MVSEKRISHHCGFNYCHYGREKSAIAVEITFPNKYEKKEAEKKALEKRISHHYGSKYSQ